MAPLVSLLPLARTLGFGAGWAAFTLLLALATRPLGLGPGFSNLVPYAIAAISMSILGILAHRWLHGGDRGTPEKPGNPAPARRLGRAWLDGAGRFFRGTAFFNNFILLTVTYVLGIGLTSLFMRGKGRKAGARGANPADSHWEDLNLGKREADAYYRPF
jgi:hypothetical protein